MASTPARRFELMHAFALFHDDVMDDAASRRGAPTTHTVFAAAARGSGLGGRVAPVRRGRRDPGRRPGVRVRRPADARRPARGVGDLERAADRAQRRPAARHPRLGPARPRDLAKAERICRYKSGKYTIERPLHLGAVLAAPDRVVRLLPGLSAYGLPLGDAFQMRDDVMGAFGDESRHRQAGRWRPTRGQADTAAGPRRGRRPRRRSWRCSIASAPRTSTTPRSPPSSRSSSTPARSTTLEQHIAALTEQAVAALEVIELAGDASAELVALADYVSRTASDLQRAVAAVV